MTSRPARSTPESTRAVSLLARVILPRPGEPLDVRKLYIEESETNARRAHAPTRTTLEIGAESEVSFATYFNAFPASYWRRWSTLDSVVLRVELTGSARVDVYRSKATGARITVGGAPVPAAATSERPAVRRVRDRPDRRSRTVAGSGSTSPPTPRSRCTARAGTRRRPAPGRANVAVGIPTFNRPSDCVNALAALTSDPLVDKVISAVIVSDQGTKKAKDHPGFEAAAAALGNRLSVHNQPNLGGSGGYSRVMYEALKNTDCEQILFMDDDIRIEPDSILRALAMNRFAKVAHARRRADAQPAGAVAPARDGRDGRPRELHVDRRGQHRVRPQLRQVSAQRRGGARAAGCCTAASTSTTTAGGCA